MKSVSLATDDVAARLDADGVVEAVSDAWLRLARQRGNVRGPATGRSLADACGPGLGALPPDVAEALEDLLAGRTGVVVHHYVDDGRWWRLEVRCVDGVPIATHVPEPLAERLARLLGASGLRMVEVDRDGELLWASDAWRSQLQDPLDPAAWLMAVHPTETARVRRAVAEATVEEPTVLRVRLRDRDGAWGEARLRVVANEVGDATSVAVVAVDVTEEVRERDRIAWQAQHDDLTGVVVRSVFTEHLRRELAAAQRDGRLTGVLFVDVDDFKAVNDRHGHLVGDRLLQAVARRILSITRPGDVVARFGGDEFVVLLPDMDAAADAETAARRVVASVSGVVAVEGREIDVAISVGVVVGERGTSPDEVLRRADDAMYAAKRRTTPPPDPSLAEPA